MRLSWKGNGTRSRHWYSERWVRVRAHTRSLRRRYGRLWTRSASVSRAPSSSSRTSILAAETTKRAINYLRPMLGSGGAASRQETVVIGTVQGDMHDIGKNLVIATLEGTGYKVVDLGVDVAPERFVEAVRSHDPSVVGFSALLSTTMVNIPRTIDALEEAGLRRGRLLAVGGAPVTQRNADEWSGGNVRSLMLVRRRVL